MKYAIVPFNEAVLSLLPHAHEPYTVTERMVPIFNGRDWQLLEEPLPGPVERRYPEEGFEPQAYIGSRDRAAFLAMVGGCCVGSVRVCRRWNGNAWIEDLAVDRDHRGRGLGTRLLDAAVNWGREQGLHGVFLETQDWNPPACRFYLRYGFRLEGMDRRLYQAFEEHRQETALYFYLFPEKAGKNGENL